MKGMLTMSEVKRSPDKTSRRRVCKSCGEKTLHIKLGVWVSMDRCHPCRVCGHLVDKGVMIQEPLSPTAKKVKGVP